MAGKENYIKASPEEFFSLCLELHNRWRSPVMAMFARELPEIFKVYAVFIDPCNDWQIVELDVSKEKKTFPSIAKKIYSANLFEREIAEMFGLIPEGNPDDRRLRLHDEVWPEGYYPLRKDFVPPTATGTQNKFLFTKVEGRGVFEVPVGPVHAGIIPPGHFRFSVAGEPIINLEIRLGYTHRGVEKLLEGKTPDEGLKLVECIAGDSSLAHSLAFCQAIEKIAEITVPNRARISRKIFLELERMYNHVASIGGVALDVGFSRPAAKASLIKEALHALNDKLCGHRFLKGVNTIGGVKLDLDAEKQKEIISSLAVIFKDFKWLQKTLKASPSFKDRVEGTGVLNKKMAEDFGVLGVAGKASGLKIDLRAGEPKVYEKGDVAARLQVRLIEFHRSAEIINELLNGLTAEEIISQDNLIKSGQGLGAVEGWRGPVLNWVSLDEAGKIERCKIVDPSFHNWLGLSYAVLGNIVPDFPVCNKSFDLSYAGNDL